MKLYYFLPIILLLPGCSTVRGNIDISRDEKGQVENVKYNAKGEVNFKINKDAVDVKTQKPPKSNIIDKIVDLSTIGLANRIKNTEKDEDL